MSQVIVMPEIHIGDFIEVKWNNDYEEQGRTVSIKPNCKIQGVTSQNGRGKMNEIAVKLVFN